ncbi:MAG TPA: ribonuclease R [Candidatus Paceibacterota bacterium]|nr:ribonuclease R [Candidatus Paceibacterota bacterium]
MAEKQETYEGPITITRTGKGFFTYDPEKPDIYIPPENLSGAFPNDTVRVETAGFEFDPKTREKRAIGKVVEVIQRSRETFVGTLFQNKEENLVMLQPDWKKMYVPFVVKGESLPLGHKVLIRFKGWAATQPYPWGQLEEIIGPAGEHETEMRALALSSGFRSDFPPGVQEEAKKLEVEGKALIEAEAAAAIKDDRTKRGRHDFRGVTTFTIDPYDAKDFDDALSVKKLDNGNVEVGIHIADVSYFVRPGTSIDTEARKRATSVYLVDRTIPMLPEVLSSNYCSLNPNEDRLAVSAVFELDAQAGIISRWFGETVIHSDKRFTYEEAQEVLDNQDGIFLEELNILKGLADQIRDRRTKKGAIAFDTPEVKIKLDETGKPIAVMLKERRDTNLLIEDFMLLANEAVAEMLAEATKKANITNSVIYRIHDNPDPDRIENLAAFLKVMGYDLAMHAGHVKGTDINQLLEKVAGTPEEYLIKTATLRSMAKAVYTTKNAGHFGLAFKYYTHFTSPIRRYPDLLIHRLVKHYTNDGTFSPQQVAELDQLAFHSSEREAAAVEAERDSIKMKQVEFLAERIGEEFDAVISGVSDRGLYVELNETRAEGMIRIRDIGDDYFIYDEKRYRLVGERTKTEYALGDPIRVKLMDARLAERELDFALVAKQ